MRYSNGKLVVTPEEKKLHVVVDPGIVDLTRALIPPVYRQNLNRQKYPPHITVIREEDWEVDLSLHGKDVLFGYDPLVVSGDVYWWLRVWSPGLISLRQSLGLPSYAWACRPPDNEDCFHITIGNTKIYGNKI